MLLSFRLARRCEEAVADRAEGESAGAAREVGAEVHAAAAVAAADERAWRHGGMVDAPR